jgi:HSP20 family protein
MELIKWNNTRVPAFKNLVDEFFKNDGFGQFGGRSMACSSPAVNVKETDKSFVIDVAAPGMKKEMFKVEVDAENVLSISAENKTEEEKNEGRYSRKEFSFTQFKRRFTLPENVMSDKIEATYVDGILSLVLPKKADEAPKAARLISIR